MTKSLYKNIQNNTEKRHEAKGKPKILKSFQAYFHPLTFTWSAEMERREESRVFQVMTSSFSLLTSGEDLQTVKKVILQYIHTSPFPLTQAFSSHRSWGINTGIGGESSFPAHLLFYRANTINYWALDLFCFLFYYFKCPSLIRSRLFMCREAITLFPSKVQTWSK